MPALADALINVVGAPGAAADAQSARLPPPAPHPTTEHLSGLIATVVD